MSNNHGADSAPPSRRSVVKGAAWAVPAVVVAGAAPTVAASAPGLAFTGGACKLPGNADPIVKGYVFELTATNSPGAVGNTVTVISGVSVNDVPTGFQVIIKSATPAGTCTCGCTPPGATSCNSFCTPDGTTQRIFIFTNTQSASTNSNMKLTYTTYDCSNCTTPVIPATPIQSGLVSTPPVTVGGGSCRISNILPLNPPLNDACT